MRILISAKIYPENCEEPTISEADKNLIAASDLLTSMQAAVPHTAKEKLRACKSASKINGDNREYTKCEGGPCRYPNSIHINRCNISEGYSKKTNVHQRRTRRNTPMPTINEVNEPNRENVTQQQSPPTKPMILVPYRLRCQPPRVTKKRTVEGQLIGIKRKDAKNTSQKRIQ